MLKVRSFHLSVPVPVLAHDFWRLTWRKKIR